MGDYVTETLAADSTATALVVAAKPEFEEGLETEHAEERIVESLFLPGEKPCYQCDADNSGGCTPGLSHNRVGGRAIDTPQPRVLGELRAHTGGCHGYPSLVGLRARFDSAVDGRNVRTQYAPEGCGLVKRSNPCDADDSSMRR